MKEKYSDKSPRTPIRVENLLLTFDNKNSLLSNGHCYSIPTQSQTSAKAYAPLS